MLLSQGRSWRANLGKAGDSVTLTLLRDGLAADHAELKDLRIDVPLTRWASVVRHAHADRKLLGGVLLDFASHKDYVSSVIASDRLLSELQRIILETTAALVEGEVVSLVPTAGDSEDA